MTALNRNGFVVELEHAILSRLITLFPDDIESLGAEEGRFTKVKTSVSEQISRALTQGFTRLEGLRTKFCSRQMRPSCTV